MEQPGAPSVAALLPDRRLRAGLFLPQYERDSASGELRGVGTGFIAIASVPALAKSLDVETVLLEYPSPAATIDALKNGACDLAFLGIEPSRAAEVDFSSAVFQFDYTFLVPGGSWLRRTTEADHPDVCIAVVRGHASELALRRRFTRAKVVPSELPDTALDLLKAGRVDALALPREQLLDYASRLAGSRVLEDGYGINRVAMAVPKGRAAWLARINEFISDGMASGFFRSLIERGALRGFAVADH